MARILDLDQLRTFATIAECGSFTLTAERLNKTQSAVSMQIKRLEETLDSQLFIRDGRSNVLSPKGRELLEYARRMVRLNAEVVDHFSNKDLAGLVRIGIPDDYAPKLLPPILMSFSQTHRQVDIEVKCAASEELVPAVHKGELDLALISQGTIGAIGLAFRREKLHWVASKTLHPELETPLPLAVGPNVCCWRGAATSALDDRNIAYRVAYASSNATAIVSAVTAGLAVGVLPESAIGDNLRILSAKDNFPPLPDAEIALIRATNAHGGVYDALAAHIVEELGNINIVRDRAIA